MDERPFSIWDRLAAAYGPIEAARPGNPEVFRRRRDARTRLFDAAAMGEASRKDADDEYARRMRRWIDRSRRLWCDEELQGYIRACFSAGAHAGSVALIWVPVVALVTALRRGLGLGTMARIHRGMSTRSCPDCRYELGRIRDGLGREPTAPAWIGPAICPECGVGWPLVPPAELHDEMTA